MRIRKVLLITIAQLIFPLQVFAADILYGFDMDEASRIMQAENQTRFQQEKPYLQPKVIQQHKQLARYKPQLENETRLRIPEAEELFSASTNGNVQLIGRLLAQGVNINASNSERETALHMAAARGHYSAVIYLVNHGANVNSRTVKNWIPLHHAVRFRHANIVNYLIQNGSSPHVRTSDGMSAIDMAKTARDQRLLGLLGAR